MDGWSIHRTSRYELAVTIEEITFHNKHIHINLQFTLKPTLLLELLKLINTF